MSEYLQICFSGPVLPATLLLMLVTMYWSMAIIGALGLDFLDFDLDADADFNFDSPLSIGLLGVKFLNLGRVPIMVWLSFFSLSLWAFSMCMNSQSQGDSWQAFSFILLRNVAVALVITKLLTQPLTRYFAHSEPNKRKDMIGLSCVISSAEVTDKYGQAKLETEGSPLLLNVRNMDGKKLLKGDVAEIVDFDPHTNVYFVAITNTEV